eukprot:scaffold7147_cov130-Isochrysis_galbana.AAC.11
MGRAVAGTCLAGRGASRPEIDSEAGRRPWRCRHWISRARSAFLDAVVARRLDDHARTERRGQAVCRPDPENA